MALTVVYVSNSESREIQVLKLNLEDGSLSPIQEERFQTPGQVMPMAVSPDRRFLYAAQRGDPHSVTSFTIDGVSGRLTRLGSAPPWRRRAAVSSTVTATRWAKGRTGSTSSA